MSKSKQFCSVYGCNSSTKRNPECSFHRFPKRDARKVKIQNKLGGEDEVDLRAAWILRLKIGKEVTKNMKVCSKHFKKDDFFFPDVKTKRKRLKRDAVPSVNLPKSKVAANILRSPSKIQYLAAARVSRLAKRNLMKREHSIHDQAEEAEVIEIEQADIDRELNAALALLELRNITGREEGKAEEEKAVKTVNNNVCSVGTQVKSGDIVTTFISNINSDKALNVFTGLPSFKHLNLLCTLVGKIVEDKRVHKLTLKERIILTLMKLKQNFTFSVLSLLFNTVTATTCKAIFIDTLFYMAAVLHPFVSWPTDSEIKKNIPTCFSDFNDVSVIFDCTEIPIQRPKCTMCRLKLYSHYKRGFTVKFMTGVSPAGLIIFISEAYGGRSSDKLIFEKSDLLSKLEKGRAIMIDKGFLVKDVCEKKGIRVIQPPFLRNKGQFSKQEALLSRKIASARVHIERSNQRLKIFQILSQKYPLSLAHVVNEVFLVICGLTNLSSSILGDNKFLHISSV